MMMATESDRLVRIDRIRSLVADAEKDPLLQKTVLRLEPAPVFTKQIDKQKGRVFDLDLNAPVVTAATARGGEDKLMASAIKANKEDSISKWNFSSSMKDRLRMDQIPPQATLSCPGPSGERDPQDSSILPISTTNNPTEYGFNFSSIKPSGVGKKSTKTIRRPYVRKRQETKGLSSGILHELYGLSGSGTSVGAKRKGSSEEPEFSIGGRKKEARVIPNEGSPKSI